MSMIYGFVNLDGRPADPAILKNMESALADKKYDAQSALIHANMAMGFKNQYITEESHFEALPCYDAETGLYFVCDAIIDNREELASLLGLRLTKEFADGQIIFEAYKKWGERCTAYLLGDFAFAVYDSKNRRVQLFRDHMGKRILYYRFENQCIYFSTLMKPLIDPWGSGEKQKLNEEYLVYFLAIEISRHEIMTGSTIYKDIRYVSQASCLTFTEESILCKIYWDPLNIHRDRRVNKKEYIEEFREIYFDAIRCRLRADGEVGIMLSGGLDSGSVACVAASILRDQNRQLHSYTAIPVRGYTEWTPQHIISDESDAVKLIQAAYPNIVTHFVDSKNNNPIKVANQVLEIFEQPYKFIDNSYWLYDIFQTAGRDGCKVVLSGCIGNWTVSYGRSLTIMYEHLMRLRLISFIHDFNTLCLKNKLSRKKTAVKFAKAVYYSVYAEKNSRVTSDLVKDIYIKKYDAERKLRLSGITNKTLLRDEESRRFFFDPTLSNQSTSAMIKFGLFSSICERDPTGDKRVVEFCMRLPYELYFDKKTGHDRSLIRQGISGIAPEKVVRNQSYGQQAVDWIERIEPEWHVFLDEFRERIERENSLREYLNMEYINDIVSNNYNLKYESDTIFNVRNIITIDNCLKFGNML